MNPVTGISLGRVALGAAALVSPRLAGRVLGAEESRNPQLPLLSRLFGSREVAVGLITLVAPTGARKRLIGAGIAVDVADAAAAFAGVRSGSLSRRDGIVFGAVATGAVAVGLLGLREGVRGA